MYESQKKREHSGACQRSEGGDACEERGSSSSPARAKERERETLQVPNIYPIAK
jgi:hypothetical protein